MAAVFAVLYWLPYLLGGEELPFGWDTPFYIWKERILYTQGVAAAIELQSPRIGYSTYLALVHASGFTDVLLAQKVAATYLAFLLLAGNGLLCYLLFKRKALAFPLAFLVGLSTYGFWRLTEDLYDNVLAFVLALTIIAILLLRLRNIWLKVVIVLPLVLVMIITHLETLAVLVLAGIFYGAFNLRNYTGRQVLSAGLALTAGVVAVGLMWLPELGPFLATYRPNVNIAASLERLLATNFAAFPYRSVGSISGFLLFGLYVPVLIYAALRGSRAHKMLLGWLMAVVLFVAVDVLLYSFSIPIYRLILYLPMIPLTVGLLLYIRDKVPVAWLGTALAVLLVVPGLGQPLRYQLDRTSFLSPDAQLAMQYLSQHPTEAIVPAQYSLENSEAYYGNWQNWVWAAGPLADIGKAQIYNGSLVDYKLNQPKFFMTSNTAGTAGFSSPRALLFKEFDAQGYQAFGLQARRISQGVYLADVALERREDIVALTKESEPWTLSTEGTGQSIRSAYLGHGSAANALVVNLKSSLPQHIQLVEVSLIDNNDAVAYFPIAASAVRADWTNLVLPFPKDTGADLSRISRVKINVYAKPGEKSNIQISSLSAWSFAPGVSSVKDVVPAKHGRGYSLTVPGGTNRLHIAYVSGGRPQAFLEVKEVKAGHATADRAISAAAPGRQYIDMPVKPGTTVHIQGINFPVSIEDVSAYTGASQGQSD
ncbi:MAG TPA: hypothetical protein VK983_00300 [Candidatus Limnocylindrales bacterium]|nr:hypothetical protein [Candidatus Limnocylindrales bacterium]